MKAYVLPSARKAETLSCVEAAWFYIHTGAIVCLYMCFVSHSQLPVLVPVVGFVCVCGFVCVWICVSVDLCVWTYIAQVAANICACEIM